MKRDSARRRAHQRMRKIHKWINKALHNSVCPICGESLDLCQPGSHAMNPDDLLIQEE